MARNIGVLEQPVNFPTFDFALEPGDRRYAVTLIRPAVNDGLDAFYEQSEEDLERQDLLLEFFDKDGVIVKRYQLLNCWPAALDIRHVDGETVEQLRMAVQLIRTEDV